MEINFRNFQNNKINIIKINISVVVSVEEWKENNLWIVTKAINMCAFKYKRRLSWVIEAVSGKDIS